MKTTDLPQVPSTEANDSRTEKREADCAPAHGSGVPDGYRLLAGIELIRVGDLLADCEGKWRGPIPYGWDGVGNLVRDYTTSKSGIGLPAARGVARRLPNND